MKTAKLFLLISLMSETVFSISIEEAFKKGLIRYEMKGTEKGNTGDCISIMVENISAGIINLEVETGRVLEASDSAYQNMIVTKRFFVRLNLKQKSQQLLYALCVEQGDGSPNESISFSHGAMSRGTLLSMAKFVEQKNLQNATGQALIWQVVSGSAIMFISCNFQPALYASLKSHFAFDKYVKFEACGSSDDSAEKFFTHTPTRIVRTYQGTFGFSIAQPADVEISVFDMQDKKVKQLEVMRKMEPDWYNYEYRFTDTGLNKGETYELRLLVNGKVKRVVVIDN
jgi:hypothetical protein